MDFYIGQIFENIYPPEAADFCNSSQSGNNPCSIKEIETINGVRRYKIVPRDVNEQKRREQLREYVRREREISNLEDYLNSTDWYVTRQTETGTPIPPEVSVKRRATREKISQLREKLESQVKGGQ